MNNKKPLTQAAIPKPSNPQPIHNRHRKVSHATEHQINKTLQQEVENTGINNTNINAG